MLERTAIKDGLRDACGYIPEAIASREQMAEDHRHVAGIRSQREAREAVRTRNSNLGAGGMQILLGLAHIRTLLHELRRKAYGQFLRQLQTRQLKLLGQVLVGESARQHSQQIPLLGQLLK